MSKPQFAEIATREAVARRGPWTVADALEGDGYPGHLWVVRTPTDEPGDESVVVSVGDRLVADFIAHAREDVPLLLAEVARQAEEIADLRVGLAEEQERAAARERAMAPRNRKGGAR